MINILFIIAMVLPMILAGIFKMWALFFVFVVFNAIFGVTEVLLKKFTGKTVSQTFWDFKRDNPVKATIILVSMALMWTALILHLAIHS
jgi:hypothetical protein